ncbi:MAG: hypothetical protein KDB22_01990 [Planctomycetales bacterium]|nr:hypothetical protein [Planctomycetales bacterium]
MIGPHNNATKKGWSRIGRRPVESGPVIRNLRCTLGPRMVFLFVIWATLSCAGCSSWLPEMDRFGAVDSPDHNRSLNGLGVHRKMWERAGAKCLTPQKLSPRLDDMDVIVLVGQTFAPPGKQARQWCEEWLAESKGRTVVYFGRDFNAERYYRLRTLDDLPEEDQLRGREQLAKVDAHELVRRIQELSESTFCGWFFLDLQDSERDVTRFKGPWSEGLQQAHGSWPINIVLKPPRAKNWSGRKPSWLTAPSNGLKPVNSVQADTEESLVVRSTWEPDELTNEEWDEAVDKAARAQILLAAADGTPLIFALTDAKFPGSQILVVANGAPLLNASLVDELHQRVGERIIEHCLPAKRVALLAYDAQGLLISKSTEVDARGIGLEMFTIWPISAITISATLLGVIICAVLAPILGRPQSLRSPSVTDFGMHVEAVGQMLFRTRDVVYATRVIRDYFLKVRGESPPDWLDTSLVETAPAPTNATSGHNESKQQHPQSPTSS